VTVRSCLVATVLLAAVACNACATGPGRAVTRTSITSPRATWLDALPVETAPETATALRDAYPHGLALTKQSERWRRFLYNDVADYAR
jgi:hypothetical protein